MCALWSVVGSGVYAASTTWLLFGSQDTEQTNVLLFQQCFCDEILV